MQLTDDITRFYDDSTNSGMAILSFDLSRAFDCVDHKLVSRILLKANFPSGFVLWLESYLSGRLVRARIDGILSRTVQIGRGVPQGSVLGPSIFCTYIGRIKALHGDVLTMKYADDMSLIIPLKRGNTVSHKRKIEDEIGNIASQTSSLHLDLNKNKSNAMVIWRDNNKDKMPLSVPVTDSMKILGVIFNVRLDWSLHVKHISKLANQRLHLIRNLKTMISQHELHEVYVSVIRALLEYACPIFVGIKNKYSKELEKIDRRAHKIIFGLNNEECSCEKTMLAKRRNNVSKKLFLNIENTPDHVLHNRIPKHLKYTQHYQNTYCRTDRRQKSFFVRVPALLNDR